MEDTQVTVFDEPTAPTPADVVASQEPTMESVQASLQTLNDSMLHFDDTTRSTQEIRRALVNKFLPDVMNLDMRVDRGTDPDLYQGQARFISEMRQLLNDLDSTAKNHVNVKLKRTDMEQQHANSIDPAAILAAIKLNQPLQVNVTTTVPQPSKEEITEKLEKQMQAAGDQILDTELEIGGNQLPVEENDET